MEIAGRSVGRCRVLPLRVSLRLDGRRPGDIARTSGLSKQAVNDQLGELERLGYLERVSHPADGRGRVVRLTSRGWALDHAVRGAAQADEGPWAEEVGQPAWQHFRTALDRIVAPRHPR